MKAVILAGGLGTRMREETEFRPKPMVEIGGRPIIWHIMKHLAAYGIHDFIVAIGYKGDLIKDYFLNYETRSNDFSIRLGSRDSLVIHSSHDESDWSVTLADTGPETLTGGRVLQASRYLDDENFIVTYGDGVSDVKIDQLLEKHRASGTLATVTTAQPSSRYGVVHLEGDRVSGFQEKPQLDGWVNIGYFVMEPEVLSYLSIDGALEERPLTQLAEERQLAAYRHTGFWQPMDTYREALLLNRLWRQGQAPWSMATSSAQQDSRDLGASR